MDRLKNLFEDSTSGSSSLLHQFIQLLREEDSKDLNPSILYGLLEDAKTHWRQFQVIQHFVKTANQNLRMETPGSFLDFLKEYETRWGDQLIENWYNHLVAETKLDHEEKTILLHSNSSSVTSTLDRAIGKGVSVNIIQTLSGPLNEGLIQGDRLAAHGCSVRVVPDSMAPWAVRQSDFVLLGADAVFLEGFRNKMGSMGICLSASNCKVPVYVLMDSRKILLETPPTERIKPSSELFDAKRHPQLEGMNYYFEDVPLTLVTSFIVDTGVLSSEGMAGAILNTNR